jgi:hypothetical protein
MVRYASRHHAHQETAQAPRRRLAELRSDLESLSEKVLMNADIDFPKFEVEDAVVGPRGVVIPLANAVATEHDEIRAGTAPRSPTPAPGRQRSVKLLPPFVDTSEVGARVVGVYQGQRYARRAWSRRQ